MFAFAAQCGHPEHKGCARGLQLQAAQPARSHTSRMESLMSNKNLSTVAKGVIQFYGITAINVINS